MLQLNPFRARLPLIAARAIAWGGLFIAAIWLAWRAPESAALPPDLQVERDIVYGERGDRKLLLDLYSPEGKPPAEGWPAAIAVHGGGWSGGSRREYGPLMAAPLAARGYVVAAIDYTLARPDDPAWPENIEDVREAVRWLRREAKSLGINPDRIVGLGSSAGGHLVERLGTWAEGDDPRSRICAVVAFYAPSDLPELWKESPAARRSVAGLFGHVPGPDEAGASPRGRVTGATAPMLLIHGDEDEVVPPDQSRRMAERLKQAGVMHKLVEVPGARHGFGFSYRQHHFLVMAVETLDEFWQHGLRY